MFISCCNNIIFCMHIETVNLLDGDYELVPANTTTPETLNYTDLNQDPNQSHYFTPYIHPTICICCNNFISAFKFSRS